MKKSILILLAAATLLSCSCKNHFVKDSSFTRSGQADSAGGGKVNLSLVCWNVQTFFDAVTTGSEYCICSPSRARVCKTKPANG